MVGGTVMGDKPILFNGEMVQAILEGRKTQTRRVVKPQPTSKHVWRGWVLDATGPNANKRVGKASWEPSPPTHLFEDLIEARCPYGRPGDLLWVRETHFLVGTGAVYYRADGHELPHDWSWRPSIFMPRWASRLTLRVTDVRVERVQDISKADAVAEGLESFAYNYGRNVSTARMYRVSGDEGGYPTAREAFENLWSSINAKRGYGWDVNPWVWVVTFEVAK